MPLNSLTINDSYTFTGTPITIEQSLSLNNPFTTSSNGAVADLELSGMNLAPGATIFTQSGSSLQLGTTASPTGFLLGLQGSMTKTGGGALVIDTSSISFPTTPLQNPVPVAIAGGSITLGESVRVNAVNFDVAPTTSLIIADNVSAGIRSLTGTGLVNLAGTTATGDTTSLTILVPNSNTDSFGGLIAGTGQFIMGGFGNLTTGSINFQGTGGITAAAGSLQVNGTLSAGSLLVNSNATFGGLGTWSFSGPVVFQSGSTFLVTLNGTVPGSQYTQLVDTDATSGVNLGFSTLAASIGYSYEQSDLFTVISAPVVQNSFVNVIGGQAILDAVPFAVSTGQTAVKLAPLRVAHNDWFVQLGQPQLSGAARDFHGDREHTHRTCCGGNGQLHAGVGGRRNRAALRRQRLLHDDIASHWNDPDHGRLQRSPGQCGLDRADAFTNGCSVPDRDDHYEQLKPKHLGPTGYTVGGGRQCVRPRDGRHRLVPPRQDLPGNRRARRFRNGEPFDQLSAGGCHADSSSL